MKNQALCRILAPALFLLSLAGAGCSPTLATSPPALESPATVSGPSQAVLAQGRTYFLRECRACHRIFPPEERSPDAWRPILARKATRVSLTAAQYDKLTAYVLAASGPRITP